MGPISTKKESLSWAAPKMKTTFLAEITKTGHQLLEIFYSITITYVLAELWIFFLSWVIFFVKKVSFPAKTADGQHHQCSSELHWFKTPASIPFRFSSYHSHYHLQWQKENVQPVEWNFKLNNQAWTFAIFNTEHKNKVLLTNWYKQLYKYVYVNLQFEEAKLLDFNVTI